jgi:hypothetical protein
MPMKMIASHATSMGGTIKAAEVWETGPYSSTLAAIDANARAFPDAYAPLHRPSSTGVKRSAAHLQQENTRTPVYNISINVTGGVTAPLSLFNSAKTDL